MSGRGKLAPFKAKVNTKARTHDRASYFVLYLALSAELVVRRF